MKRETMAVFFMVILPVVAGCSGDEVSPYPTDAHGEGAEGEGPVAEGEGEGEGSIDGEGEGEGEGPVCACASNEDCDGRTDDDFVGEQCLEHWPPCIGTTACENGAVICDLTGPCFQQ